MTLANEIYPGNTVHYQIQKLSYKSKKNVKRPKEDWMRIENTHEPLVDRETWDLVQGHINSRKRSRKNDEPQIFAGLLKCGECGWSLSSAGSKNQSRYYRCSLYFAHGKEACSLHFITYNLLFAFVLGRLQYWLMAVKKNEDAILERLLQSSEKQRTVRERP